MQLHRGNLILVGLPGSGKTTLGRQLARRFGKPFHDADLELEARLGVSIPTIFEIEGEVAFRDREAAVIGELSQRSGIVLATGGGAVLRADNREHLAASGSVLYLHASPQSLWRRVRHNRHRPLLNTGDPLSRLAELYAERDPLYRSIADWVIESDREHVSRFAAGLEQDLRNVLGV
ncbi:MAG: shikimate kinase [Pseudomonadota bacterium]|nr:shikimate kinase [Pseudomonadota bacterium]